MNAASACRACLVAGAFAGTLEGREVVALRPDLTPVANIRAPPLWETLPDADRVRPRIRIEPETAGRWVRSPGEPMPVHLRVPDTAGGTRALLTVWDWYRHPVYQQE